MQQSSKLKPYLVVFTAALFFMFEFINMNSFNVLNDALRAAFQVNALQISNLSAMYFYANVLFLIPAGLILDRVSTRKLLLTATMVCIVSNLVFAVTHEFWVAELCRFVTGIGSTFALLSSALLTSRWISSKHAGMVMGFVVTLAMLGGMLAQQMRWLMDFTQSWRLAVIMVAGLGFIFWLCIFYQVSDYPPGYHDTHASLPSAGAQGFRHKFALAFRNKQIWCAGIYSSLINLTVMILGALWGQDYLMISHGFTATEAASAISMIFLGLMLGSPLFGIISDHFGRRKLPMLIGGILNLLMILLILYLPLTPVYATLMLFMLGLLSSSQIITYPLIIESVPRNITASSEAISATLIMGGGAVFQPLFGWLLDRFTATPGQYTAASFNTTLWMLPLAFLVATLVTLFLHETYCQAFKE